MWQGLKHCFYSGGISCNQKNYNPTNCHYYTLCTLFTMAKILQSILEISTTCRLVICRLCAQCMISKSNVKSVPCDGVFVVIYFKIMIPRIIKVLISVICHGLRLGWYHLPRPWLFPNITKTSSNNIGYNLMITENPAYIHMAAPFWLQSSPRVFIELDKSKNSIEMQFLNS